MLTKILSVSGKPGLYKLISTGKNLNVVESLSDGKRIPVYMTEKVVALSDVSIYTEDGDIPLNEVFVKIKEKENGEKVSFAPQAQNKNLFDFFAEILPNFDRERVYVSDIKKLISWYNILVEQNIYFSPAKEEEEKETASQEKITTETKEKNNETKPKKNKSESVKANSKAKKTESHARTKH